MSFTDDIAVFDYETIEEHLGNILRRSDNLDFHSENFFPVSIIDMLFHFSEKLSEIEKRRDSKSFRNFHGHDFDRWIDNMIADIPLYLKDDDEICKVKLIDIDCISINLTTCEVSVTLPDETTYAMLFIDSTGNYKPLMLKNIEELTIHLDIAPVYSLFTPNEDNENYDGFGSIAHLIRVVCEKSNTTPDSVDKYMLSNKIFNVFKFELLPLIPSIWNDMEVIYDTVKPQLTHV